MVTYGGEQSLDRYLALSARGVPFNVAHAVGNFAIAFAAGPALVRMISRYRDPARVQLAIPAEALPRRRGGARDRRGAGRGARAATEAGPPAPAADARPRWLAGTQNADGGFAADPGEPSSPAMTGWVMLGLEAAGRNPLDVRRGGETPIAYLRVAGRAPQVAGDLERTILGARGRRARSAQPSRAATWSPRCAASAAATARSTARST